MVLGIALPYDPVAVSEAHVVALHGDGHQGSMYYPYWESATFGNNERISGANLTFAAR